MRWRRKARVCPDWVWHKYSSAPYWWLYIPDRGAEVGMVFECIDKSFTSDIISPGTHLATKRFKSIAQAMDDVEERALRALLSGKIDFDYCQKLTARMRDRA